jgi:hypothetical protein
LKIVVCFKVTPDFEQVLPSDFENFSSDIDLNYVRRIINCFDEAALELALRIKDGRTAKNLPTECVALTYADALQSTFSRAIFAAGFDEIQLIKCSDNSEKIGLNEGNNSEFDSLNVAKNLVIKTKNEPKNSEYNSLNVAKNLADRIKKISPDLILTGKQAGYADSGTVPFYLGELLELPVFSDSVFFENAGGNGGDCCGEKTENCAVFYENSGGDDAPNAERFFYGGITENAVICADGTAAKNDTSILVSPNAIVCVGDTAVFNLRISPLKRLLAVSDRNIEVFQGVEYSEKAMRTEGFYRPKSEKKCRISQSISSEIKSILKGV